MNKEYQNLSHLLFKFSRFVIFISHCFFPFLFFNDLLKNIFLALNGLFAIYFSKLYERKMSIFSPSYIYFFIVISTTNCFCSFLYDQCIDKIIDTNVSIISPSFFYGRQLVIILLIITLIMIYKNKKNMTANENSFIFGSRRQLFTLIISFIIIIIPLRLMGGAFFYTLPASFFFYINIYIFFNKLDKNKNTHLFLSLIIFVFILLHWKHRFVFVELLLPTIFGFCCCFRIFYNTYKLKIISFFLLILFSIVILGLYGSISEMVKLNKGKLIGQYNVISFMENITKKPEIFVLWFNRQLYRMFLIWVRLSSVIMEYVHENGFFLGSSYFHRVLSSVSGVNVNIPTIIAKQIRCTYAQPGLFGEGYANFGYFGSYISLLIPFLLSEYLLHLWLKYKNMFCFTLLCTLLSKVILDGGSINSMFNNILFVVITYSLIIINKFYKRHQYFKTKNS